MKRGAVLKRVFVNGHPVAGKFHPFQIDAVSEGAAPDFCKTGGKPYGNDSFFIKETAFPDRGNSLGQFHVF